MSVKTFVAAALIASLMAFYGCSPTAESTASAGPSGGDLVPIKDGAGYAEFLANADTGEVTVHTWDKNLTTRQPIENAPITVGSGDTSVELTPHPMDTDPSGRCSRFYGEAGWLRGGGIGNGWMHGGGIGGHKDFAWQRCWQAGRAHGYMWEEMGRRRRMGAAHGHGHGGGPADQ